MDVLTASNENSALISTINSAEQSQILPFNYALEKNIPAHGLQIVEHTTVSGSIGKSKAHDFDINKYGYLRSLVIQCKVTGDSGTAVNTFMGGLGFIESIELLSSGRRLQYMSRDAYLCALSDLPREARKSIENSARMVDSGTFGTSGEKVFHIPVLMSFFDNVRNTVNARFNEALRLRVTTTDGKHCKATNSSTPAAKTLTDMTVLAEYRRLPMPLDDKVVQEDFGDNQPLTKVIYDYSEETALDVTLSTTADTAYKSIEIKDNGAVDAIFLIVQGDLKTTSITDAHHKATQLPLELTDIKLTASGQTIMEVPARYLEFLGKRTLGNGFYGTGPVDSGSEKAALGFVYKIQLGLDHDTRYFSNLASLRELNTPTVEFKIAGVTSASGLNSSDGTAKVIVRKAMLMTTDASSGKNSVGVSN
jgi:hypothetical protein